MKIDLYLNSIEKEIDNVEEAIKICKDNTEIQETLKRFLEEMKRSYYFVNELKTKLIPMLKVNKSFLEAYIFQNYDGDYTVDVIVNETADDIKELHDIRNAFEEENECIIFFNVYKKSSYNFDELEDYDYLKCD